MCGLESVMSGVAEQADGIGGHALLDLKLKPPW